jgi:hypothetical protein
MNATNLVTCFETSKLLKTKGFPQDTFFRYVDKVIRFNIDFNHLINFGYEVIAAPTVAEILKELPKSIELGGDIIFLNVHYWEKAHCVCYQDIGGLHCHYFYEQFNESLPEALASLLLKVREK